MRKTLVSLGILAVTGLPQAARSAPILAIDVDPASAGIQSVLTVAPGTLVPVDVVISGVTADESVNGFEFDLEFAPSVLTATSVVDGGFLLPVVFGVESDLLGPDVEFAEVTLGVGGAVGSGVLARILFEATGLGTSLLTLGDVILTHVVRPGVVAPVPIGGIANASVSVGDEASAVVPEPTGALLFAVGGVVVAAASRRRGYRA